MKPRAGLAGGGARENTQYLRSSCMTVGMKRERELRQKPSTKSALMVNAPVAVPLLYGLVPLSEAS